MSIRIGVGTGLGQPTPVDEYRQLVQFCEQHDIDSIWHSDQLMRPGLEPVTMLAALAATTTKLRFGMNAVVIPHRDPLILAKQCATIDHLAPGRLLPVFGVGDESDPVWRATGRESKGRGKLANEAIMLFRRLLEEESVSFQGEYFHYEHASIDPRPSRPLPIWIGGQSDAAIERTAALGDGWLGGLTTPVIAGGVITRIKAALGRVGRHIDDDHYGVVIPFRIGSPDDAPVTGLGHALRSRRPQASGDSPAIAVGDARTIVNAFRQYIEAGVSKFVAIPLADDREDRLRQLRHLAEDIRPLIET